MDPYKKEEALYDEVDTEEELSDNEESNDDSSDDPQFECSDHDSDTEQEDVAVSSQDAEKKINVKGSRSFYYYGKDGTKWKKQAGSLNVRTRQRNIVTHLSGVKAVAKNARSPLECWMLFFNDALDIVVKNTNLYINKIASTYTDKSDVRSTDAEEMKCLLGLLYLAGSQKSGRKHLEEFFSKDGLGSEIFPAAMSLRRMRLLLRCLRFDDTLTRDERKQLDKLAAVRSLVENFNEKLKCNYSIGPYATLDEMLLGFRGRCSFKVYIPNKPNKYGLKVFSITDAKTMYTSNIEIYAGTQPDGPYKTNNSTAAVTERMCLHLSGSSRNVTMDRWFTSVEVVRKLLVDHKLTVVGTIRSNSRQLPQELTYIKNREVKSSKFAFNQGITAVSYVPKKSKNVLVISSMHLDDKIDGSTGEAMKPDMITFYNQTKSGVDAVDRMASSYNTARNTRRWPMVVFYGLLNVGAINAAVIYRTNQPDGEFSKSRRLFLKCLGIELVQQNLQRRAHLSNLPRDVRLSAARLAGISPAKGTCDPLPNKRGWCKYCKRTKTRFYCKICKAWLCMNHITACCSDCLEKNTL